MKFSTSYEPGEYESEIYAAWEAAGVFNPKLGVTAVAKGIRSAAAREVAPVTHGRPQEKSSEERACSLFRDADERTTRRVDGLTGRAPKRSGSAQLIDYYSIVMPPPNANGNLHIGHGLTIAIEDSLTRYHRLRGDSTWYIPGADHAGFETWVVYERELEKHGHTRFEFDRNELYARVWDFVTKQRGNMELQLRALGASCAWDDLTFTLDENVIDRVYTTFEKMWNDGLIYRGEKLVNFCPKHQTAFADIEVDHKDEKGTLWEIEYRLADNDSATMSSLIVSTTRPETLFGDTAVAVNPEDERYKDLIGNFVYLPLTDRKIPIIADEHADPEYGTGVVKITPAHDFDDFEVGERHDLPRIQVISEDGTMINVPDKYAGMTTKECRKQVLKDLKAQDLLKGEKSIEHSVARCYKCDTVLEPTLKEQWFVDVKKLARAAIEHLNHDEIKFHPASKKQVLINYLENLKDWNISRQIPWGIAIPMFRKADETSSPGATRSAAARELAPSTHGRPPEKSSRERACSLSRDADEWTTRRVDGLDGRGPRTEDSSASSDWIFDRRTNLKEIEKAGVKYIRDEDTFDTWFSSSHWPIVCTDWSEDNPTPYYPLNVMETGADILFAWVARMIMMGLYVTGEVPFREVYLHGLVLDAHGQKMSKSKGNVINPMDLVAKYGSDAFRLGILRGRSAGMNQAFSENSVIAGRNLCNKLWNISRLIQSIVDEEREGVSDNAFFKNAIPSFYTTNNMGEDWICREINDCLKQVKQDIKEYRFAEAVEILYQTIWDKYADWFLESQKIYKNAELLKATLEAILIAFHPFAPFVTETIWQNLSWTDGFIITAEWPHELEFDAISAENFESIITIVNEVRATLQALPGTNNAKKYELLYDNDSIVNDNQMLIKTLTRVPAVNSLDGSPRGLRLALANHELYLDVPEKVVKEYKDALTDKILAVGRELDALNARMMNPNYVEKAPAHLVKETQDGIKEKEALISRLKSQLELI